MDEVHFQQHGSRCRMWVAPEIRDPVCRHAPTRKSISYFGAVRIRDGRLVVSKPEGRFDAQTCWTFLRKLRRCSRHRGRRVFVIVDNARYHHAAMHAKWRRKQEPEFVLLFLPPYSPQLNPIERVWKLLRKTVAAQPLLSDARRSRRASGSAVCGLGASELRAPPSLRIDLTCSINYDVVFKNESQRGRVHPGHKGIKSHVSSAGQGIH